MTDNPGEGRPPVTPIFLPQTPGRHEDKPRRKLWPWIVAGLLLGLCAIGAVALATSSTKDKSTVVTRTAPTTKAVAPKAKALPTSFGNGTFTAGEDVQAGTYKAKVKAEAQCVWQVQDSHGNLLSDKGGAPRGGVGGGFPQFTVANGERAVTVACPDFVRVK